MTRRLTMAWLCAATLACGRGPAPASNRQVPDARVRGLADAYLTGYLERNPEQITLFGIPGRPQDRLTDNSPAALQAWHEREDRWLTEAKAIDPATIEDRSLRATYAIVRETLEASIGARVCRAELWNVSQMTGWQIGDAYLVTIQPVGSDAARAEARARWGSLPRFLDTEIADLREGLRLGYSAPKRIVRIVIDQMNGLIGAHPGTSPFDSPANRDDAPSFQAEYAALVKNGIVPAFKRYRDFLEREYLPAARDATAVMSNPRGAECYAASIRYHSSLSVQAREVHDLGLREIDALTSEMQGVAERSFHTSDVPALLQQLRTDPQYTFRSRADLIEYSQAALARVKAAAPRWFGLFPKADVVIKPYPAFREKNGPNEYNPPAEDGSRPAVFFISAYQAEKQSRADAQSTAFHETIPGHHLQTSIALERKEIHPIGRYLGNSGYAEGWGLYAERLADEMNLYSSDLDRMGMLSSQALRAARLVVDSGLHVLGWSRQQAIDYMLAHTTSSPEYAASEVDRYIIYPGQATAYTLGMLDLRSARDEAQRRLGAKFDIKAFHDRVLEDGGVPLTFLHTKIRDWADAEAKNGR